MKKINKVLYAILGLIVLLVGFIGLCVINPGMSKKIGDILNKANSSVMADKAVKDSPDNNQDYVDTSDVMDAVDAIDSAVSIDPVLNDMEIADASVLPNEGISSMTIVSADISRDYIAPADDALVLRSEVLDKAGLESITSDVEELDDNMVRDYTSNIDEGNSGDDWFFDPTYYPYYYMLNEDGQHVYRQVYANMVELYPTFTPVENITEDEFQEIFFAVMCDHPELFWVDTEYTGKKSRKNVIIEIDLKFNYTADDLEGYKEKFERAANRIIDKAKTMNNEYEMEKYVHNALVESIDYVDGAELNQSAYSALINGETVCAGYARSFQYIMQQLEVPCYFCSGYTGESHAWNIVYLDGDYYNVDVTWADTDVMTYNYFNKTDDDYSRDHARKDISIYLPACEGEKYKDLEENPVNTNLRTVEDTELTDEDILYDMDSYYDYCYDKIIENGKGKVEFSCVLSGMDFAYDWYDDFQSEGYVKGYLKPACKEIGANTYVISVSLEELQDDKYMITHKIRVK